MFWGGGGGNSWDSVNIHIPKRELETIEISFSFWRLDADTNL